MQADDFKITAHKPCVNAQTDPAGQVMKAIKIEARTPAVAPDALDITALLADVVTISGLSAQVPEPGLCKEAAIPPQPLDTPHDVETKDFTGTALKGKIVKGERCLNSPSVIAGALDYIEPEKEGDVVTISRGLNTVLKSALFHGTGSPREIDLPQGVGINSFLMTLLNEVLPGWSGRLIKVYRRKSGAAYRDRPDSEGREEQGRNESTGHENDRDGGGQSGRRYHTEQVKVSSTGVINTADRSGLRFRLDIDIGYEEMASRAHGAITLAPVIINYAGLSGELEDARFAFEAGDGEGPGFGRMIIDLVEAGTAQDGSVIYGLPGDYRWIEEKSAR